MMFIVGVSLSVLAAHGFDAIKTQRKRFGQAMLIVGFVVAALWLVVYAGGEMWLGWSQENMSVTKRNLILPSALFLVMLIWYAVFVRIKSDVWRRVGYVLVVGVVVFDLFRFGWKFTPFTERTYFFPTSQTLTFLKKEKPPFRVMSLDDRILPPNTASFYQIESIEGYDPVVQKRYEDFMVATARGEADLSDPTGFNRIYTIKNIDSSLLPYMNVRFVLSLSDVTRPFLQEVFREGEVRVYRYSLEIPRVYVAEQISVLENKEDILNALMSGLRGVGIVERAISVLSVPISPDEGVQIVSYDTSAIKFQTVTINPRLVVILNAYNSRWRATIDGKNADLIRANYAFTGIVVPAGTHAVSLSFR